MNVPPQYLKPHGAKHKSSAMNRNHAVMQEIKIPPKLQRGMAREILVEGICRKSPKQDTQIHKTLLAETGMSLVYDTQMPKTLLTEALLCIESFPFWVINDLGRPKQKPQTKDTHHH